MFMRVCAPVFLEDFKPPGFKTQAPTVVFREFDAEIAELRGEDAPVAMTATSAFYLGQKDVVTEYRHDGSRFLKRAGLNADQFARALLEEPLSVTEGYMRSSSIQSMLEVYQELLSELDRCRQRLRPRGFEYVVRYANVKSDSVDKWIEKSKKFDIGAEHFPAVLDAEDRFRRALGGIVLIDGEVWCECRQPLLALDFVENSVTGGRIVMYDGFLPERPPAISEWTPSWVTRLYPMSDLKHVMWMASKMIARNVIRNVVGKFAVEIHRPEVFEEEFPAVQDAARVLSHFLNSWPLQRSQKEEFRTFLSDPNCWNVSDMEDFIRYHAAIGDEGVLETALHRLQMMPVEVPGMSTIYSDKNEEKPWKLKN